MAAQWAFIQWIVTVDRTDYAVKLRLHVDVECFVRVYTNVQNELVSFIVSQKSFVPHPPVQGWDKTFLDIYTLVLNRARIYGRDCDGGIWHRHPQHDPTIHDFSAEGRQVVTLAHFLSEVQNILQDEGLL